MDLQDKTHYNGIIKCYKVLLVAQGFTKEYGIKLLVCLLSAHL